MRKILMNFFPKNTDMQILTMTTPEHIKIFFSLTFFSRQKFQG